MKAETLESVSFCELQFEYQIKSLFIRKGLSIRQILLKKLIREHSWESDSKGWIIMSSYFKPATIFNFFSLSCTKLFFFFFQPESGSHT